MDYRTLLGFFCLFFLFFPLTILLTPLQSRKDNAAGLLHDATNVVLQTEMMEEGNNGGATVAE